MKKTTMKIGIINIMPKTATYHDELLSALDVVSDQVEYFWIRLQTKSYAEEDLLFMADRYQDYSSIKESVQLDALIVTGAPVELLDFSAVNYWPELKQILQHAMATQICTLGICWGALAIGQLLDIGKTELEQKTFGVFNVLTPATSAIDSLTVYSPKTMPFSIQAKFSSLDVAHQLAAGRVRCLGTHPQLGGTLLCSSDQRHLLCLGHPEYGPYRLLDEWRRDLARMPGLLPPSGLDVNVPMATWRDEADSMFGSWMKIVQRLSVHQTLPISAQHASTEPAHSIQNFQRISS